MQSCGIQRGPALQTSDEVAKGLPCISFDYKIMGESPNEDDKITTLVGRDRWTKLTFAHVVKGKGFTDENIMNKVVEDIESLGCPEVRLKADTENAVLAVLEQIKEARDRKRAGRTIVDPAIAGQPQTNRAAEMAAQELTEQLRKYKIALETNLGKQIFARSAVFKWLVPHAADTISRHQGGHDGKVPYQRLMAKPPKPIEAGVGEQVWAKTPTYLNRRKRSLQERAILGTYLGVNHKKDKNSVAISPSKAVQVRTINRRPEPGRWSANIIDFLQASADKHDVEGQVVELGNAVDAEDIDTGEAFQAELDTEGVAAPKPRRP